MQRAASRPAAANLNNNAFNSAIFSGGEPNNKQMHRRFHFYCSSLFDVISCRWVYGRSFYNAAGRRLPCNYFCTRS